MARLIFLQSTESTNTYLHELLRHEDVEELTAIVTYNQTAGRGQTGNHWDSEKDKNIALSVLLQPEMDVKEQFGISMAAALAVTDTLKAYDIESKIKWPNDIYIDIHKVCGILIENELNGHWVEKSIVGIGLNVNQRHFAEELKNAVSMVMATDKDYDLQDVTRTLTESLRKRYFELLNEGWQSLKKEYMLSLVNGGGETHRFTDVATGEAFEGIIENIEPSGRLVLQKTNGEIVKYYFKEVRQQIGNEERE